MEVGYAAYTSGKIDPAALHTLSKHSAGVGLKNSARHSKAVRLNQPADPYLVSHFNAHNAHSRLDILRIGLVSRAEFTRSTMNVSLKLR